MTRFLALSCYAFLLFPGFLQVGYYYFFSKQVRRGIVYGDLPRNRLDLYLPKNSEGPKPVVAFVTGGAWIIGYKAWGSLLGQQLSERDVIVACIDDSFDLNKVLEFGALVVSGGQEYDIASDNYKTPKERLARQKQNLRRRLGP